MNPEGLASESTILAAVLTVQKVTWAAHILNGYFVFSLPVCLSLRVSFVRSMHRWESCRLTAPWGAGVPSVGPVALLAAAPVPTLPPASCVAWDHPSPPAVKKGGLWDTRAPPLLRVCELYQDGSLDVSPDTQSAQLCPSRYNLLLSFHYSRPSRIFSHILAMSPNRAL